MAALLTRESLRQLLTDSATPCLSLFQPTHRTFPEREQDPIRFKALIRQLEGLLRERKDITEALVEELLKPLRTLAQAQEFWNHSLDGLAAFSAPGHFQVFHLQRRVPELAVVNDRPSIRPLVRIVQSADRYQILCLTLERVRLYEGNRDGISRVPLAEGVPETLEAALGSELTEKGQSGLPQGYGRASERAGSMHAESGGSGKQDEINSDRERFFRLLDKAILEHHSRPTELPLLLAALPDNQAMFRALSRNEFLLPEGIPLDPGLLNDQQLRDKSWQVMQPRYLKRLEGLVGQFQALANRGQSSDQLNLIAQATREGRVATLLVEADRNIPGHADRSAGQALEVDSEQSNCADLLEELASWTIQQGGEVVVVPQERMPTRSGAAAIYRY